MAKKRSKAAKKRNEALQTRREIWGVSFVALGVFLGVCLYFDAVGVVGKAITEVLFGLFGLFAYALPVALAIGGILLIACASHAPQKGRVAFILLGVLLLLTLLQVIAKPLLGTSEYLPYIKSAYALGKTDQAGGGALGALLCYPLLVLTGEAGAYIFSIAGILIILLLVTRLSLRQTGQQAAQKVKTGIQHVSERRAARQQLYTEPLGQEDTAPRQSSRKPSRTLQKDMDPLPASNLKPRPRQEGPDLTYFPSQGFIEKKKAHAEEPEAPEPMGAASQEAEWPIPEPLQQAEPFSPLEQEPPSDPLEPDDFVAVPVSEPPASLRGPKFSSAGQNNVIAAPFGTRPAKAGEPAPAQPGIQVEAEPASAPAIVQAEAPVPPPYQPPAFSLLNSSQASYSRSTENPEQKGILLVDTLLSFNVSAKLVDISVGPVITRFELQPAPGVRVNKITALADDIALALAAPRVRIEAPIPGKAAVGIEIPNKDTATVVLRDIVESREFAAAKSPITLALGKDIAGKVIVTDLAKMPHLLIAGATGSGKSVCINDIIISLVYKSSPQDLQLILVDPKVVELSVFGNLPHLKVPVVTEPKKAAGALCGAVKEMTDRYRKFAQLGARDLARYNELQESEATRLPKLVIIIDELADLMMVAPDTVEDSICRIAQLGRACGIHLIVATQRPSADIITGLIKANIPSRIAFAVSSAVDSRIILDTAGAEKLLGRGDMLFHPNGAGKPMRVQGAYVSDEEVERVVRHFQNQDMTPQFDESLIEDIDETHDGGTAAQGNGKQEDELLGEAVRIVLDSGQASISMIQRRLRVGYARAARLVDIMEQKGYVSGFEGSKPRKLLITRAQYEQIFGSGMNVPMADDDPNAPWARKPGEPPPWEEVPFSDDADDE